MEWKTTTEGGSPEMVSGVSRSPRSEAEWATEPGALWAAQGANTRKARKGGPDEGRQPGEGEWRSRSPRSEAERVTEPGAPWAAQGAMPQGGAASVSSVDPPSLFLRLFVLLVAKSQSTLLAAMGRR